MKSGGGRAMPPPPPIEKINVEGPSAPLFLHLCIKDQLLNELTKDHFLQQLDEYNSEEGGKLKAQLEKRYYINSKLALQVKSCLGCCNNIVI